MARHGRGYPSRLPRFQPLHRDTGGAPPPTYDVNDLYLVDRAEGGYAGTYDDFYLGKTYTAGGGVTAATILVRIGAAWVAKPLKRYNGSTWVTVPDTRFKYWNGSSWTQVPPQ